MTPYSDIPALSVVPADIFISPDVFSHPNMIEMQAMCTVVLNEDRKVIGTANTQRPELYAWRNPVPTHRDSMGTDGYTFMYFCILSGRSTVFCRDDAGTEHSVTAEPGQVVRLIDKYEHWTEGEGDCIALFLGTYSSPCDDKAVQMLSRGAARLTKPHVYFAPRSFGSGGVLREDEVYAAKEFGDFFYRMRRKAVERFGLKVFNCKFCSQKAVKVDKHWPYDDEHRCHNHL